MSSELSYSFVFWNRVSIAMCYKTIADVEDGFGDRAPACRECRLLRADSDSRIFAAIPGSTHTGPVIQVHTIQFLGIHGIGIQIPSTTTRNRISWVVFAEGGVATRMEYISEIQDNTTSTEVLLENLSQKKVNFVLQSWSNPASGKLMRRSSKF